MGASVRKVRAKDVAANTKRGGDLRLLLSPLTVGATSGFMGVGTLQPGERIIDHAHPYSEEFLYVIRGALEVVVDGQELTLRPGEALMVPRDARHRLACTGDVEAEVVFHNTPLAPRPELGHVDFEPTLAGAADPVVGG